MSFWRRLFTEHPATVNESYFQHLVNAWRFGFRMIGGGIVCLLHGLLPSLFCTAASETIGELHDRMVVNRRRVAEESMAAREPRAA